MPIVHPALAAIFTEAQAAIAAGDVKALSALLERSAEQHVDKLVAHRETNVRCS